MSVITDLIGTLTAEGCPATAFYDYLNGVTLSSGKVASVAGQVGTEPALTASGSPLPTINTAATGGITTDGVQNSLKTVTHTAFTQGGATWLVLIGSCGQGASGGNTVAVHDALVDSYYAINGYRTGAVGTLSTDGELYGPTPRDAVVRCYIAWWSTIDPTSGASNLGIETLGRVRTTISPNDGGYISANPYQLSFGLDTYGGNFNQDTFRTIITGTGDLTRKALLAIQTFAQQQRGAVLDTSKNRLITIGDSLTFGYPLDEATQAWPAIAMQDPFLGGYELHNLGITNLTEASMYQIAPVRADPSINPVVSRVIVTVWAGTNDVNYNGINDVGLGASFARLCAERRQYGAKVIAVTMIKRGTFDATMEQFRQNFNAWVLANYRNFADAVADVASNPNFSSTANTTYYQADVTHLTAAGYVSVATDPTYGILPVIKALDWTVKPGASTYRTSRTLSNARVSPSQRTA